MPESPVLADSSYYIRLSREGRNPLQELQALARRRDVATCGIVRCEVARGLRVAAVLEKFRRAWDVMLYVPADHRIWQDTETLLWQLDRAGTCLPLSDVMIACCARRIGAVVLTFDEHFQRIPGIRAVSEIG
ncbi:MAG: PIN domain-containing protein [Verrucomicrobiales bacterium]|nr:PIN domain-containing protein [Verrucomicrobiales bacterium]